MAGQIDLIVRYDLSHPDSLLGRMPIDLIRVAAGGAAGGCLVIPAGVQSGAAGGGRGGREAQQSGIYRASPGVAHPRWKGSCLGLQPPPPRKLYIACMHLMARHEASGTIYSSHSGDQCDCAR